MKNLLILFSPLWMLFYLETKAQGTYEKELINFSDLIEREIYSSIGNAKLDTNDFVGFYMIKFSITRNLKLTDYGCSKEMPKYLCAAVKESIVNALSASFTRKNADVFANKTFLIPAFFELGGRIKTESPVITYAQFLKLFKTDDKPGLPYQAIVLSPVEYTTHHYRSLKKPDNVYKD
jgi:hypothetical protein